MNSFMLFPDSDVMKMWFDTNDGTEDISDIIKRTFCIKEIKNNLTGDAHKKAFDKVCSAKNIKKISKEISSP